MMVRLIGFPTRETNSSQASSSQASAQRQTMSFRDRDEYRLVLGVLSICYFWSESEGGKDNCSDDANLPPPAPADWMIVNTPRL